MADDLQSIIDSLKSLLTFLNPVPIEADNVRAIVGLLESQRSEIISLSVDAAKQRIHISSLEEKLADIILRMTNQAETITAKSRKIHDLENRLKLQTDRLEKEIEDHKYDVKTQCGAIDRKNALIQEMSDLMSKHGFKTVADYDASPVKFEWADHKVDQSPKEEAERPLDPYGPNHNPRSLQEIAINNLTAMLTMYITNVSMIVGEITQLEKCDE